MQRDAAKGGRALAAVERARRRSVSVVPASILALGPFGMEPESWATFDLVGARARICGRGVAS